MPPRKFLQNKHSEIESKTTLTAYHLIQYTYILELFSVIFVQFAYIAYMISKQSVYHSYK